MNFSVIIPTYRRPKQLVACLRALARLEYARDAFEVVVVDDGSPDSPALLVERHACGMNVRLVRQRNAGPAAARNTGAYMALGRWLAFTDDDCAPAPRWLSALEARLAAAPDLLIGGRTVNALARDVYATASQSLIDFLYHNYDADATGYQFFASNNFAVRADRFRELGGFGAEFPLAAAEDRDFCERWQRRGWWMAYAKDAVVYHAHAMSLRDFARQHFDYGRGAFHLQRARLARGEARLRLEGARFYWSLVNHARGHGWRTPLIRLLSALSQAAYGYGYYSERTRRA